MSNPSMVFLILKQGKMLFSWLARAGGGIGNISPGILSFLQMPKPWPGSFLFFLPGRPDILHDQPLTAPDGP